MFLHLSVILYTGEGCLTHCTAGIRRPGQTPLGRHPLDTTGYGQQVGGAHPIGMNTSFFYIEMFTGLLQVCRYVMVFIKVILTFF